MKEKKEEDDKEAEKEDLMRMDNRANAVQITFALISMPYIIRVTGIPAGEPTDLPETRKNTRARG